ncbi:MAG: SDR family oxidoreductase [bacterium]|nr:SDR family oxidoreductase [bacterium]
MILLTGASGFFGKIAWRVWSATREVYGVCRTNTCGGRFFACDLTNPGEVRALLNRLRPDVIVHAAAVRDPDLCERQKEYAWRLHVEATRQLAAWCRSNSACLVYISTDYVFDGNAPPYAEDAPVNPLNVYGKTKAEGEHAAREAGEWIVVRIPLQYGYSQPDDDSLVLKVLSALRSGETYELDDRQARYPTLSDDVAVAILALLERGERGIFHLRGPSRLTRYEIWCKIAEVFAMPMNGLRRAPGGLTQAARRPLDCELKMSRYDALGLTPFHDFEGGLKWVREAMQRDGYDWRVG